MTASRTWRAILVCLVAIAWILVTDAHAAQQRTDAVAVQQVPQEDGDKPKSKKSKKKKKKEQADDSSGDPDAEGGSSDGGSEDAGGKAPKHPSIKIGKDIRLELAMRIEGDLRGATPVIGREDASLEWQDRRIGIQGTAFKRVTFEVSRELTHDFEEEHGLAEKTAWRDIYANYRVSKALNFKVGRFKLPFGHDELTGEPNLDFTYRSLIGRVLSPGRDTGAMVHGRVLRKRLEYQFGYFTKDGSNGRTAETEGGRDAYAGQLIVAPFAPMKIDALSALQFGVANEISNNDNRYGLRGRTVLGDQIFFDRVYVNGRRSRVGVEASWAYGPVSAVGEYITVSDQRTGMGFDSADLPAVHEHGWYVAGTWTLTGEKKKGRVEPRRDVFRGGFGAVELVARVEKLTFDPIDYPGSDYGFPSAGTLSGNADHVTTFGVNWYLNHYLKIMANVINESIDDPERSPAPSNDGKFRSVVVRFQFRM